MNQCDLMVLVEQERFKLGESQLFMSNEIGISLQTYQTLKKNKKNGNFSTITLVVKYLKSRGYEVSEVEIQGMTIKC